MTEKRIDWYRTPLPPGVLKELTQKSDLKGLLHAGSFLLLWVATTFLCVWFVQLQWWIPLIVTMYLHGIVHSFMSMSAGVHELSHGTSFKTKKLNEFFYKLFCFLTWNNPIHFRTSHTYHHQFTVHRGVDKEIMQEPVEETISTANLIFWFTLDVPWLWKLVSANVGHAFGHNRPDFFYWDPLFEDADPKRKEMIKWARIILFGHIALMIVFAIFHFWILIYCVTFGSFFAMFLAKFCGALQHTGLSENIPDWRVVCFTAEFNPIMRFLYWNMNYHVEHHMYAAVPFYNLPKLHKLVAADFPIPQKSFIAGIRTLFRIRKEQKKDPSYLFSPSFPPTAAPVRWS